MGLSTLINESCANCTEKGFLEVIEQLSPRDTPCITSDGVKLDGEQFQRLLCNFCGCIFCKYQPENTISAHYLNKYDLSDETQNNFIMPDNNLIRKKNYIEEYLISSLEIAKLMPETALEIACGNGQLLETLEDRLSNIELTGIDPNLDAIFVNSKVNYIRDFFSPQLFTGKFFDLIIAHGFLNRSPTLKEIKNIRQIINEKGIFSVEVMVLENSFHAPKTWDHSFWFTSEIFEKWLHAAGFKILSTKDYKTTKHYICQAVDNLNTKFQAHEKQIRLTRNLYFSFKEFWHNLDREDFLNKYSYIFGAGMYASLLINHLNLQREFTYIIDEIKTGKHQGVPIVPLKFAEKAPGRVLVFTRNSYTSSIAKKLESASLDYDIVTLND